MECLLPYLCMVIVPRIMVRLERMLDYRGVGLVRFHCTSSIILLNRLYCKYVCDHIVVFVEYRHWTSDAATAYLVLYSHAGPHWHTSIFFWLHKTTYNVLHTLVE